MIGYGQLGRNGYRWLDQIYDRHISEPIEAYGASDGTRCSVARAGWPVFKPWWTIFRDFSKRYACLYWASTTIALVTAVVRNGSIARDDWLWLGLGVMDGIELSVP